MLQQKLGTVNRVADTLSRQTKILTIMKVQVAGFNTLKELYAEDPYFDKIFIKVKLGKSTKFQVQDGFLFKGVLWRPESQLTFWPRG